MNDDEIKKPGLDGDEDIAAQTKLLDEENLPDHLLVSSSEVKKKRVTKQYFNELFQIANIEMARVYQNITAYLRHLSQKRLDQAQADEALREKIAEDWQLFLRGEQGDSKLPLTADEIKKIEEINQKFDKLIELLDKKIAIIDSALQQLGNKIDNLKDKISDIKSKYIKLLEDDYLLSTNNYQVKAMTLRMPKKIGIKGAERIQIKIEFGEDVDQRALAIFKDQYLSTDADTNIYAQCLRQAFKEKMLTQLTQYKPEQRELIAAQWLELPAVKSEINMKFIKFSSALQATPELRIHAAELAKITDELKVCQIQYDDYLEAQQKVKRDKDNFLKAKEQFNLDVKSPSFLRADGKTDLLDKSDKKLEQLIASTESSIKALQAASTFTDTTMARASKVADELQSLVATASPASQQSELSKKEFASCKQAITAITTEFDDELTKQIQALLSDSKPAPSVVEALAPAADEPTKRFTH